ncbi:phosphatase PAP2 family protein [Natronorubrum halophilum]|uniref:phosphatase PAP2 family protein n=1 Tax=Natronorubrum halophilum TaxID=1702106 RepID=UPI000EF72BC7|nr:phosphatase PAP2 family protein [Natronorubrum halophilum]
MLTEVLTNLVIVVAVLLLLSIALFVGRERLETTRTEWRARVRTSGPTILVLLVVLVFNRIMRWEQPELSLTTHMTSTIRSIEGDFVLIFQEIATPELTEYFSFIYVYGYTFLLIFPAIAYFALSDTKAFRRLMTAYALNYALGVVLYMLVIAYGPRNVFAGELATVLYDHSPEYQYVTREVNQNTNVFPSLHTSLSATVGVFAFITRSSYPKWFPVALVLSTSVIISTMYLAIHWAVDVVAGLALAAFCVYVSYQLVGRWSLSDLYDRVTGTDRR